MFEMHMNGMIRLACSPHRTTCRRFTVLILISTSNLKTPKVPWVLRAKQTRESSSNPTTTTTNRLRKRGKTANTKEIVGVWAKKNILKFELTLLFEGLPLKGG
jgi:hypothetical protein